MKPEFLIGDTVYDEKGNALEVLVPVNKNTYVVKDEKGREYKVVRDEIRSESEMQQDAYDAAYGEFIDGPKPPPTGWEPDCSQPRWGK